MLLLKSTLLNGINVIILLSNFSINSSVKIAANKPLN